VVAGDTTAASVDNQAHSLASGSYSFWKDAGANVGDSFVTVPTPVTGAACLSACDNNPACAAAAMTGATDLTSNVASCKLIKGDSTVAQFKRTVTKTVATQLKINTAV
jgi:hypothetical protein